MTGAAGFIGSSLIAALLDAGQGVVGLDDFSSGTLANLDDVARQVGPEAWGRFTLLTGDITRAEDCRRACDGADYVLHHAALGSVPGSIADPLGANAANVTGFLQVLLAAQEAGVRRVVYASSSAVYGDSPTLPAREEATGRLLSPYAVSKYADELYAQALATTHGIETVGLRYFNVYGPRQSPTGAYAAVVPKWIGEMLAGQRPRIHGDGQTSRDFCHVADVVQANLRAALVETPEAVNQVYNIGAGCRTSLNELFSLIRDALSEYRAHIGDLTPLYGPERPGDIRHSQADISKAARLLEYTPQFDVARGLRQAAAWYVARHSRAAHTL